MTNEHTNLRQLSPEALAMLGAPKMVYIREIDASELKADGLVPSDTAFPSGLKFYAVHAANGQRMAILDDREAAFSAARQNEMEPVSVH
jgi:hypothetical protein